MKQAWPRTGKAALAITALLALALTGAGAWAKGGGGHGGGHSGHGSGRSGSHHGHHRGTHPFPGSSSSTAFYGSYWAFPAYWYAQSAPTLPAEPVYYIERSEEELRSPSTWYYCESEAAYYPYVSKCPAGWVKVEPFDLP
jgi:hypothetical protein